MTRSSTPALSDLFQTLLPRLRCPRCASGSLSLNGDALTCGECSSRFPVDEGIPLLAVPGSTRTWMTPDEEGGVDPRWADDPYQLSGDKYQEEYQDVAEARKYNEAYQKRPTKRWSTNREHRLLRQLLGSQPRSEVLLDLPSGGGRLSPVLEEYADVLVEADIGLGQLHYARRNHPADQNDRVWMTASGYHIPFQDGSVDGVVCCRLCHHLPTPEERERLLSELLRVSRRFVIMTYFDYHSVKNYVRRLRQPFDGQPPKMTMTTDGVRELARSHGAELVTQPPLSRLFSGHRYGLMVKR
ncbi:MAG: class I SAM-dependent methyltransferase [Gemmatimonadota bacterium]